MLYSMYAGSYAQVLNTSEFVVSADIAALFEFYLEL
jgi:hypothetical protein